MLHFSLLLLLSFKITILPLRKEKPGPRLTTAAHNLTNGQVGKKSPLCSNHKPFIATTMQTVTENVRQRESYARLQGSVCAGRDGRLLDERAADSSYRGGLRYLSPGPSDDESKNPQLSFTSRFRYDLCSRQEVEWEGISAGNFTDDTCKIFIRAEAFFFCLFVFLQELQRSGMTSCKRSESRLYSNSM